MRAGNLKIESRRDEILQRLDAAGRVSVTQLSEDLGIAPGTIRRDLTALEREGYVIRMQGGAMKTVRRDDPYNLSLHPDTPQLSEKHEIARLVLQQIRNGDTLFLNSGTTTQCIAEALRNLKNLNVITNSLAVATCLGCVPSFRVTLLGGEINAVCGFTYGSDAQEQLRHYNADWSLLSVDGVSLSGGITTYHPEEAVLNRMMMVNSKSILIAADHTKIGRIGFVRLCSCEKRIGLVTDGASNAEMLSSMAVSGLRIFKP